MPAQSTSQFRRPGQRDDRRRRLLADEALAGGGAVPRRRRGGRDHSAGRAHYPDPKFLDAGPRLVDLLPRGRLVPVLVALGLAGCVAGLVWLDRASRAAAGPLSGLPPLEFQAAGNLAAWFRSLLLLVAAAGSVVVYTVRRHRTDDYQGRYRVWLWAAACWVLLAAETATGLHAVPQALIVHWTGTPLWGDGDAWWLGAGGLLLVAVGSRLLVDLWQCRTAALCLVAAAACGLVSLATDRGWIGATPGEPGPFGTAAGLSAAALALLAVLLNGRHVRLDAEGLLERPAAGAETSRDTATAGREADGRLAAPGETDSQPADPTAASTRSDGETDESDGEWVRVESAHGRPQPVLRRGQPAAAAAPSQQPASGVAGGAGSTAARTGATGGSVSTSASTSTGPSSAQPTVNRKLTKAEKKALRERLLAARLQRQQQSSRW